MTTETVERPWTIAPTYIDGITPSDLYECINNGAKCPKCGANASGLGRTVETNQCILVGCGHTWTESK